MPSYFDFEVTLREAKPRVWRRFLIAKRATFLDLHEAIQAACGRMNCHLFDFHDGRRTPIAGLPDDEYGEPDPDAKTVKPDSYFADANACIYEYDFGDSWEHDVKLGGWWRTPRSSAGSSWAARAPSRRRIVAGCQATRSASAWPRAERIQRIYGSGWAIGTRRDWTSRRRGGTSTRSSSPCVETTKRDSDGRQENSHAARRRAVPRDPPYPLSGISR